MKNNVTKYGIMLIAAVLLAALAFAGAGAAMNGNPVDVTANTEYHVLVVDDVTGAVSNTSTPASLAGGKNVYLIEDIADWNKVATTDTYNNQVLILGDNLDFSGESKMITYAFCGKIYGNGYLLNNFSVLSSEEDNLGLIKTAASGLYLNYVQLTNATIAQQSSSTVDLSGSGLLIGKVSNGVTAKVIGCAVYNGTLAANGRNTGGLVGIVEQGTLTLNHSKVFNLTTGETGHRMGGLIGSSYSGTANVFNCTVADSWIVNKADCVGGLIGASDASAKLDFSNCTVENSTVRTFVNTTGSTYNVGGLIGYLQANSASFKNCDVTACNITSQERVGGLVGVICSGVTFKSCNVTNSSVTGKIKVGGLFGSTSGSPTVTVDNSSVLRSNIIRNSGSENTVAGIIGKADNSGSITFTTCHAGIDADTALYVSTGYPQLGGSTGSLSGCTNATLLSSAVPLTFLTEDNWQIIKIFPATRLPYVYVVYDANDGVFDAPYTDAKQTVAMPYVKGTSAIASNNSVNLLPRTGGYAFEGWNPAISTVSANNKTVAVWNHLTYVEVSDWDQLVENVTSWTDTTTMRTIALINETAGAYKNVTGSSGVYGGMPVSGMLTITVKGTIANEIKIDANQKGRLFYVKDTGNLTLVGNSTKVLNLTNAKVSNDYGGAIILKSAGKLTLSEDAKITDSSAGYGGAVCLYYSGNFSTSQFTMDGGDIVNCQASQNGGAVYIGQCHKFIMNGGNITDCTAAGKGAGVYLNPMASSSSPVTNFTMTGGNITDSTVSSQPYGLFVGGGTCHISNTAVIDGVYLRVDEYYGDPKKITVDSQLTNGGNITNLSLEYPNNPVWFGATVAVGGLSSVENISLAQTYRDMGYNLAPASNGQDLLIGSHNFVSNWTELAANVSSANSGVTKIIVLDDDIDDRTAIQNVTGIEVKGLVIVVSNSSQHYSITGNDYGRIFNVTTGTLVLKGGPNGAALMLSHGQYDGNGGAVYVGEEGNLTILSDAIITASTAVNGGGVYVEKPVSGNYNFKIGGNAAVTGNNKQGSSAANNVYLNSTADVQLKLVHDFNGTIGIAHAVGQTPAAGKVFGNASSYSITDSGKFVSDFNGYIIGTVVGENDLTWKDTTPVYTSSSSKQSGYTVINQTVIDTPKPTVAPTAAPTQAPIVNPTVKPTTQPTTSKSPVPVAGLIAGLGAAALVLARMRK